MINMDDVLRYITLFVIGLPSIIIISLMCYYLVKPTMNEIKEYIINLFLTYFNTLDKESFLLFIFVCIFIFLFSFGYLLAAFLRFLFES